MEALFAISRWVNCSENPPFFLVGGNWKWEGFVIVYKQEDTQGSRCTMTDADILKRIVVDPAHFGGKPIVRGRRITVEYILEQLSLGTSPEDLLHAFPILEMDDIRACLAYANRIVANEEIHVQAG
jgi:uncharacterized protein (DUF433 family)